ncbi:MAG TPA: cysteine--tRNA ligase [Kiritimatiellia bacterium]|nr:cysteine--tRNA ligase [Kiritimatiellia bacterium]
MSMKIFNTLSRTAEELVPLEGNHVRMYTCGPTVYNFAHIGNFRAYMFEDLLRRYLRFRGFRVTQVMNLTDVDDKTIRGCRAAGLPLREYTQKYKDAFFSDLKTLSIEPAEHYPAATDHVPAMIALIEKLLEKGFAYRSDDGSVYFSIAKFPGYGKLAHLDLSGLRAGARVAHDEYEKENLADFALWKAWDEEDGDVVWDAPWGRGRPGWHIECSAMSMHYLGDSFDLHTGGMDNIFPHHEDEIAQSEAATGKPWVKYWMHCAHLIVDGKKMSKSAGNFFTLRDILDRGWSGRDIRYVLLTTHYRQTLNFSFDSLEAAHAALQRVDEFTARLKDRAGQAAASAELPDWAREAVGKFTAALDDDLNISGGMAAVFDMIHAGNRAMDRDELSAGEARRTLDEMARLDRVLGFLTAAEDEIPAEVTALVEARKQARAEKNWAASDRIRDELAALGWTVKDTPEGPKLRKL